MFEQNCGVDGFGKDVKVVALGDGSIEERGRVVVAGDEQDATVREQLTDGNRGVDSIHAFHHHVGDEVVKVGLLGKFETTFGAVHGVAGYSGEEEFLGLRFACMHHKAGDLGVFGD